VNVALEDMHRAKKAHLHATTTPPSAISAPPSNMGCGRNPMGLQAMHCQGRPANKHRLSRRRGDRNRVCLLSLSPACEAWPLSPTDYEPSHLEAPCNTAHHQPHLPNHRWCCVLRYASQLPYLPRSSPPGPPDSRSTQLATWVKESSCCVGRREHRCAVSKLCLPHR
jgi:hypothetical protein